jgi:zinc transporter ZupT
MLLALMLGLLTTVANIAGAGLAAVEKNPSKRLLTNFIAFGGGFLLGAAILEMAPEAFQRGEYMPAFIALGYLIVYLGEHLFGVHLHRVPSNGNESATEGHEHHSTGAAWLAKANVGPAALVAAAAGLATLVAFNIHDFVDGLAIGAAMMENQRLGTLVFLAVLLHEIPAGFTLAAVLRGSGVSRRMAILAGVSIGLITLLGIAIPFMLGGVNTLATDIFLALATGTFIYVGASLLVPVVETGGFRWSFLWVVVGFAAFYGTAQATDVFLHVD